MFSHPAWKALIFVLISIGWASHAFAGVYFIHADHLGTPRVVSDPAGTVVWKADYDTFGKATLTTNVYALNLRFPGQYFDAETNLHYNYFRDYDPAVGRYLQSDPIGLAGGINTYAYANNNPLRFTDPTGEFIVPILKGIAEACFRNPKICAAIAGGIYGGKTYVDFENCVEECEKTNEDCDKSNRPPGDTSSNFECRRDCLFKFFGPGAKKGPRTSP